jgi:hypothetical protein
MKNKLVFLATAVFILVLAFSACQTYPDSPQVGEVTVTTGKVADSAPASANYKAEADFYIVSWEAIPNARSYSIYVKEDGKETEEPLGINAQNDLVYANDGSRSRNNDIGLYSVQFLPTNLPRTGTFHVGVRTTSDPAKYTSPSKTKFSETTVTR